MASMFEVAKRDPSAWAPVRTYRCGELYDKVKAKAESEERTVTDVILAAFAEYVDKD